MPRRSPDHGATPEDGSEVIREVRKHVVAIRVRAAVANGCFSEATRLVADVKHAFSEEEVWSLLGYWPDHNADRDIGSQEKAFRALGYPQLAIRALERGHADDPLLDYRLLKGYEAEHRYDDLARMIEHFARQRDKSAIEFAERYGVEISQRSLELAVESELLLPVPRSHILRTFGRLRQPAVDDEAILHAADAELRLGLSEGFDTYDAVGVAPRVDVVNAFLALHEHDPSSDETVRALRYAGRNIDTRGRMLKIF